MDEIKQANNNPSIESTPRWKIHFWPVVIAILLTTVLFVSLGYFWQMQSNQKQQALEDYIKFLQNPSDK
jgi:hypothetical protein